MMFWIALAFVLVLLYCYLGYPILVAVMARLRPRPWLVDNTMRPMVSIILPAYNEELVLRSCVDSLVGMDYPVYRLELLIGSDGSTDRTNVIIADYCTRYSFVRPFYFPVRRGKMLVLNDLVERANGEILLFVDADVTLLPDALQKHVRNYASSEVGGVAGLLAIAGKTQGSAFGSESTFLSIETTMRKNEGLIGSTVGLYGGNYSMLRSLWKPLRDEMICDDFQSVLTILDSGKRLLFEKEAVSIELYGRTLHDEFKRKTRYASRSLYTMRFMPHLLVPFRSGVAWMLWPHKLLRWLTPVLLIGIVLPSILSLLWGMNPLMQWLLIAEAGVFGVALIGWVLDKANLSIPFFRDAHWFLEMNVAFAIGVSKFLVGKQPLLWSQPTRVADPVDVRLKKEEAVER